MFLEYDIYAKPSNFGTMIFMIYTYILLCYYLKVLAIHLLDLLTQTDSSFEIYSITEQKIEAEAFCCLP